MTCVSDKVGVSPVPEKDFNNSILTRSRCKTLVDWANFCVGTKLSECMFQSGSLKSVTRWWASSQTPHSWEPRRHPCPPRWSSPPPPPPSACHLKNFRSPSLALHYFSKATKNIKFSQGRICGFTNKSASFFLFLFCNDIAWTGVVCYLCESSSV